MMGKFRTDPSGAIFWTTNASIILEVMQVTPPGDYIREKMQVKPYLGPTRTGFFSADFLVYTKPQMVLFRYYFFESGL